MLGSLERFDRLERKLDRWLPEEPLLDELPAVLAEYVPALSPQYDAPQHLAPYLDAIASTLEQEQRLVLSIPPRHAKTETTLHAFPWLWDRQPDRTHCYVTYESGLARSKSRRVQQLATDAGYQVSGTLSEWFTGSGGGFLATGAGGPLTGRGISGLLVIDDPIKNRQDAESPTIRNRIHDWARDVAFTRLEPGASCVIVQTRWHVDDLAGRQEKEGWPVINIPAVACDTITGRTDDRVLMADGQALWPERWSLEALERKRFEVGEHTWASLFQGRPRPRGSKLFEGAHYYRELPKRGYRVVHGVDLAYSNSQQADWSVCVTMYIIGRGLTAVCYVVDVRFAQCKAPQFVSVLEGQQTAHPGPMWWHLSGTEQGSADFITDRVPQLRSIKTTLDKYLRALPASEAWNNGRILVPESAPWLQRFLGIVQAFTGLGDPQDDEVDALGSAYAAGQSTSGGYRSTKGRGPQRRM